MVAAASDVISAWSYAGATSTIWNYQKAITLDSESPNFHYNLGLTYYEIGNYSESIDSFKRVESLVPSQTDTYYNIALAHYNRFAESALILLASPKKIS